MRRRVVFPHPDRPITATNSPRRMSRSTPETAWVTPALVWKSARGEYAVEDAAMHRWFQVRLDGGKWPPAPKQGGLAFDEE